MVYISATHFWSPQGGMAATTERAPAGASQGPIVIVRILSLTTLRLLFGVGLATCPVALPAQQSSPARPPLVVFLAVDQMRGDYLTRYRSEWRGGFRTLLKQAAWYPNGHQEHAMTETAPGHATMLTGRDPAHVGIVTNELGVPDPTTHL